MMILNNFIKVIVISMLLLTSLFCSVDQQVTGGTTDSGNARIQATVVYNGIAVAGALVRVRPQDYISGREKTTDLIIDTITDNNGKVNIQFNSSGIFTLEAIKDDSLGFVNSYNIQSNDTISDNLTLSPTASLTGTFLYPPPTGVVKIVGLEHVSVIDSNGRFTFPNIPGGTHSIYIETDTGDSLTIPNIPAVSEQSSRIEHIDITATRWGLILPNTFQSDSVVVEAFLEDQKSDSVRLFSEIVDTIDGRIRTINLSHMGITELHPSIGNCDFIYTLDISGNNLTTIPPQIEKCRHLSSIIAENNRIREIPVELCRLRFLEFLKLSYNQISHINDSVFFLQRLRKFAIGANPVDSLSFLIGNLKTLEQLDIFQCGLAHLPDATGELVSLQQIWAANNKLTTLPVTFSNLRRLEILQLSSNQLTSLPNDIGELSALKNLMINDNNLSDLPESILNLQVLDKLMIDKNRLCTLSDKLIEWVQTHTSPEWFNKQTCNK